MAPQSAADRLGSCSPCTPAIGWDAAGAPDGGAGQHRVKRARGVHTPVRLADAERDRQWQAVAVSDEVQFGPEPTAAVPRGVVGLMR